MSSLYLKQQVSLSLKKKAVKLAFLHLLNFPELFPFPYIVLFFYLFFTERINYDAIGWERLAAKEGRLFAVRTLLWGYPSKTDVPANQWPILEIGEHTFPFVCQMPVINYPPTFHHHLISTAFKFIVSVERPGKLSILSRGFPVTFRPIIETAPVKNIHPFTEETKLTNHVLAQLSLPRLAYNVIDERSIPVSIQILSDTHEEDNISLSQLRVSLKRYYDINYKNFSRSETTVIAETVYPNTIHACPYSLSLPLNLPEPNKDLPYSLAYSPYLKIEYKLVVTAKVRHGPLAVKKKLFEIPLLLGTLPAGTQAPRQLENFNYNNENVQLKNMPSFLRPQPRETEDEEYLPAYDSDCVPPRYLLTAILSPV
jgi:hypothetical protein